METPAIKIDWKYTQLNIRRLPIPFVISFPNQTFINILNMIDINARFLFRRKKSWIFNQGRSFSEFLTPIRQVY